LPWILLKKTPTLRGWGPGRYESLRDDIINLHGFAKLVNEKNERPGIPHPVFLERVFYPLGLVRSRILSKGRHIKPRGGIF
jgi:hypothetical protein